ncbi:c-type cytochrome [Thermithiobacillus tepidarius DSM 3134]|uniref:c-type cytochrome n=1 Tax=Thermithiobacillus tepidarius TaxID=929 RepID=UPI000425267C|nr:c-type cytochrome [Thermithiobacillus tepidarius]
MRKIKSTALLMGLLAAGSVYADNENGRNIVMQGNGKGATACMSCHQADGAGMAAAGFPRLSGLSAEYLAQQLKSFKDGSRDNPMMKPIAAAMSDAEIKDVAEYYAAQKAPFQAPAPVAADLLKAGERLAKHGNWSKDVPACIQCHGADGTGVGQFPGIAGQHASYISNQIQAWKAGTRRNDPVGLMKSVSGKLSAKEIEAVAAYFASLPAVDAGQDKTAAK